LWCVKNIIILKQTQSFWIISLSLCFPISFKTILTRNGRSRSRGRCQTKKKIQIFFFLSFQLVNLHARLKLTYAKLLSHRRTKKINWKKKERGNLNEVFLLDDWMYRNENGMEVTKAKKNILFGDRLSRGIYFETHMRKSV
jgi:hypothetical protein